MLLIHKKMTFEIERLPLFAESECAGVLNRLHVLGSSSHGGGCLSHALEPEQAAERFNHGVWQKAFC